MADNQPLNDTDRANLVAYLDGELDARSARAVEARLKSDEEARTEVSSLRKTWQLLDHLPRSAPSKAFTSQTLQKLSALRSQAQPAEATWRWRPWMIGLTWAAAVLLAGVIGFVVVSRAYPPPSGDIAGGTESAGGDEKQKWIEQLPRAHREELERLRSEPAKYETRVEEILKEEQTREREWRVALEHWDQNAQRHQQVIAQLQALRPEIEAYINEALIPMLSVQERNRLRRSHDNMSAKNQWQPFLKTLVLLSDKHPVKLPGPSTGPSRFDELPAAVQKLLPDLRSPRPQLGERLHEVEGKWPDYAQVVRQIANRRRITIPALGPTRPTELATPVREFINTKLMPALDKDEAMRLQSALGQWPLYPRQVLNLARAHQLQVPLMGLPGAPELWETFREKPTATAAAAKPAPTPNK
jgi:hypothetical protein